VTDPKDYRFCGYGEAVAGNVSAQCGLRFTAGGKDWNGCQASYREVLFGTGAAPRDRAVSTSPEELARVVASRGKLAIATVLRCRVRYFSDGAVLGSRAFVQSQLAVYQKRTGLRSRTAPRAVPQVADWGDLMTLRGLRQQGFG
jgi:putative transposase